MKNPFKNKLLPLSLALKTKGFALILVLWVLSLLTIMAGSFALSMRRESAIVAGIKNTAQAAAVAETGVMLAELMLMSPDKIKRWQANGVIYQVTDSVLLGVDNAEVRIRLTAETGKIDINKADQKLLLALLAFSPLKNEKEQMQLSSAILDWRDQDDLINIDGAEKKEYLAAGLDYLPRNKPFQTINELQLVLGMNETLYQWMLPFVTIYSGKSTVNMAVASKEVLQVLPDIDHSLIDEYMAARLASTLNGTPPPNLPIDGNASISPNPSSASQGQNDTLSLIAEAQLEDGSSAIISTVLKPQQGSANGLAFQMLEWHRNSALQNDSLFTDAINANNMVHFPQ